MPAQPKPKLYDPAAPENKYPKMVYPGEVKADLGTIVNSKEEHDALLAKHKPVEPPKVEKPADDGDDKDALLETALSLGVKADKRWGVQRLKDAIAEKQKAAD